MNQVDAAVYADIAFEMHDQPDVDRMSERVTEYARDAADCDGAGLLLRRGRRRIETAGATDESAEQADVLQAQLGQGPGLRAMEERRAIVHDTRADDRWPQWGSKAAGLGLRSVLSVGLSTGHGAFGALNLYTSKPREFAPGQIEHLEMFARHASLALAEAHEEQGLRQAIEARHVIGQAQGILMERFGLDAERAFGVLRRYSRDNNVKLRDVAEQVIQTRRMPG